MQFGFMQGHSVTDALFILRQARRNLKKKRTVCKFEKNCRFGKKRMLTVFLGILFCKFEGS